MKLKNMPGYGARRVQLLRALAAETNSLGFWDIHPHHPFEETTEASHEESALSPMLESEPSMAMKRWFFQSLGFRDPMVAGDWNPRLSGRFEFPVIGAPKINNIWREQWDKAAAVTFGKRRMYCTGESVDLGGISIEIAYLEFECLTPIGLVARDLLGHISLIRGFEVGWDPQIVGTVIELRLAGLKLDSPAKRRIAASLPASVVLEHPGLIQHISAGQGLDGLYLAYSIGPTELLEGLNVTPAVSRIAVGYCVAELYGKKRVRFIESESSVDAVRLARLYWTITESSWIIGQIYERDPDAAWDSILPKLTSARTCEDSNSILQAGSTVQVISESFRLFGEISVSLGAYHIPADEWTRGDDDLSPELFDFCLILGGKMTDERFLLRLEFAQMQSLLWNLNLENITAIAAKEIGILTMLQRYPKWIQQTFRYGGTCGYRQFHYGDFVESNPFAETTVGPESVYIDQTSRTEPKPGIVMTWGLKRSSGTEPSEVIVVEQNGKSWYYLTPTTHRFSRSPGTWVEAALKLATEGQTAAA